MMNQIDLFPLPLVLFPGGRLPLQIFEKRYLDMIRLCLKEDKGFGVVMIESGDQVIKDDDQASPNIAQVGSYCKVVDFNLQNNGLLQITLEARCKFKILSLDENADRLLQAKVEYIKPEADFPIPEGQKHLGELLSAFLQHTSLEGSDIKPESAFDLGARLTELLPCANYVKQELLELSDPLLRLEMLEDQIAKLQE